MASSQKMATTSAPQARLLPSLSLVVSMSVTYRRLLVVCCLPPIVVITAPICLGLLLGVLNFITQGYGVLFAVMASLFTLCARRLVFQYAPSKKRGEEALRQSRIWLPLASVAVSLLVIRFLVFPIATILGIQGYNTLTSHFHFPAILRLAAGVLLLGLAVVARYVGPASVVRCSSVPLVSHPMACSMRSVWARCTSVDGILDVIAGPSDIQSEIKQNSPTTNNLGRRYQRWTNRNAAMQIVFSAVVGTAVAYTTVLSWYQAPHNNREHTKPHIKAALITTCLLTSLFHLLWTTLDGKRHELNPQQYHSQTRLTLWSTMKNALLPVFQIVMLVPLLSICVMFWANDESIGNMRTKDLCNLGMVCFVTALLISVCLAGIDEAARAVLCVPGLKLKKLLRESWGDTSSELCLDVMLNSVLHGDLSLVRNIWSPTQKVDTEEEEIKRNDNCIDQMAHILLHNGSDNVTNMACLEQDVLRVLLLESLGGSSNSLEVNNTILTKASLRHVESVKFWVDPGTRKWDPVVVPLVRGLCAYAGGLGEALLSCNPSSLALKSQRSWQVAPSQLSKSPLAFVTWSLPHGAILCAKYAIEGAARCVVWDLSSNKVMGDWRSTSLSTLVPSVMHAAFRMSCGVQSYAQYLRKNQLSCGVEDNLNWVAMHKPELRQLLLACDDAAVLIMKTIEALDGKKCLDIRVQSGCKAWLKKLEPQVI